MRSAWSRSVGKNAGTNEGRQCHGSIARGVKCGSRRFRLFDRHPEQSRGVDDS
uniref:Uncharacterized protein n=1 Tax=Plectus sambesii TaxID=2011161 RepID=A0A914VQU7_9BILA